MGGMIAPSDKYHPAPSLHVASYPTTDETLPVSVHRAVLLADGTPTGRYQQRYFAFSQEVCKSAFLTIYPISSSTLDHSKPHSSPLCDRPRSQPVRCRVSDSSALHSHLDPTLLASLCIL